MSTAYWIYDRVKKEYYGVSNELGDNMVVIDRKSYLFDCGTIYFEWLLIYTFTTRTIRKNKEYTTLFTVIETILKD